MSLDFDLNLAAFTRPTNTLLNLARIMYDRELRDDHNQQEAEFVAGLSKFNICTEQSTLFLLQCLVRDVLYTYSVGVVVMLATAR